VDYKSTTLWSKIINLDQRGAYAISILPSAV